jgi:hypothetical protein
MSRLGKIVSGAGPSEAYRWTEAETLYLLFKVSRNPAERKDCQGRLAAICIKAVGHLTPPWRGKWNPDFDSLRHKARAPWVYRWVDEQLKVPQKDMGRYIGRRCRHALADEIRAAMRKHRVKPELTAPSPAQVLGQRQELMAALGKHIRHATKSSGLTPDERLLGFDSVMAGKPLKNVDLAGQWGCSEGQVRKVRASLLKKQKKLRLGKEQRKRHWEEKEVRQRRAAYRAQQRAGKRGVKDVVWWDKKRDSRPFGINDKK